MVIHPDPFFLCSVHYCSPCPKPTNALATDKARDNNKNNTPTQLLAKLGTKKVQGGKKVQVYCPDMERSYKDGEGYMISKLSNC